MDGARYDYCTPETMPNLFSFMKEGLLFKNAYSTSSWTLPSHASLFTGLYPQQHGVFRLPYKPTNDIFTDRKRRLETEVDIDNISVSAKAITLADILRDAGYQTIGVFGNPCYGYPIFNLNKGFGISLWTFISSYYFASGHWSGVALEGMFSLSIVVQLFVIFGFILFRVKSRKKQARKSKTLLRQMRGMKWDEDEYSDEIEELDDME